MKHRENRKSLLKHVIIYSTIGIVIFSIAFIGNSYIDINFLGNKIDLRFFGVIFLASMMGYTLPALIKLYRLRED